MDLFTGFIVIYICVPRLLKVLDKSVEVISLILKKRKEFNRLKLGYISLEDLRFLTPNEFHVWCEEFLRRYACTGFNVVSARKDRDSIFSCTKNNSKVYVECIRPLSGFVGISTVKNLVGCMLHDNISEGIIITTESFNHAVLSFIKSLPTQFKFTILDGMDLVKDVNKAGAADLSPAQV